MPCPLFLTRWATCLHLQAQAHPHSEIISSPGQGILQEALAHTTLAGFQLSCVCLGLHAREPGLHLTLMTRRLEWCRLQEVRIIESSQKTWERLTILALCKGHWFGNVRSLLCLDSPLVYHDSPGLSHSYSPTSHTKQPPLRAFLILEFSSLNAVCHLAYFKCHKHK